MGHNSAQDPHILAQTLILETGENPIADIGEPRWLIDIRWPASSPLPKDSEGRAMADFAASSILAWFICGKEPRHTLKVNRDICFEHNFVQCIWSRRDIWPGIVAKHHFARLHKQDIEISHVTYSRVPYDSRSLSIRMISSSPAWGHDATATLVYVFDSVLLLTPFQSRNATCSPHLN